MKKIIVFLLSIVCLGELSAQEKGWAGHFETRAGAIGKKEFRSYEFAVGVGYNVTPLFTARAVTDVSIGHYKKGDVKRFSESGTLGALVGFNIVRREDITLLVTASTGNTIGSTDWKFFYTDAGIKCGVGSSKMKFMYGVGVRYFNSQRSTYRDYTRGYATFGMLFN